MENELMKRLLPMEPVSAVEIVPGKKYVLIIKEKLDAATIEAFRCAGQPQARGVR